MIKNTPLPPSLKFQTSTLKLVLLDSKMSTSAKKENFQNRSSHSFSFFLFLFFLFFFLMFLEVTITVTTQAEFCLAHRKTSGCRTQRNRYYEVFRDVGKDMHGQSAGPSGTQQRGEDSLGKDGWRGERDRGAGGGGGGGWGGEQDIDLGRNLKSWTTEIPLVSVSLHGCAGGKHHGVIKKEKQLFFPCFFGSGPSAGWGIHRVKGERSTAV